VSEELSAVSEGHRTRRRHAGRVHRGPDGDLLVEAALIALSMVVFGGFFTVLATFAGI
jgi:hypothetical protein